MVKQFKKNANDVNVRCFMKTYDHNYYNLVTHKPLHDYGFVNCFPNQNEFSDKTKNCPMEIVSTEVSIQRKSLPLIDIHIFKIMNFLCNLKKYLPLYGEKCGTRKPKNRIDAYEDSSKKPFTKTKRISSNMMPVLRRTSFFTILAFICLETILLSTMSTCAKTFYMHWNTSNSIFRIDNTDHIIDVNKGNVAFEFDQVHIICPVYEPGTYENETEKYIIYNVSKVEYETCRITNADPRVIAICDKPHKLMFFTITFRPFTPQPGGLEFLPGNDYYFISTSSKDDLYRRIGGRCSTNNMKVVFKVCCATEDKNKNMSSTTKTSLSNNSGIENQSNNLGSNLDNSVTINNNGNSINTALTPNGILSVNTETNNVNIKPINNVKDTSSADQFNRIPIQTIGVSGGFGFGNHGVNGILLTPGHGSINMIPNSGVTGVGMAQYPGLHGQGGMRINNIPQQHYPSQKSGNGEHFDKHPNEVVKNEELTYNSGASSTHNIYVSQIYNTISQIVPFTISKSTFLIFIYNIQSEKIDLQQLVNNACNPNLIFIFLFILIAACLFNFNIISKLRFSIFRTKNLVAKTLKNTGSQKIKQR